MQNVSMTEKELLNDILSQQKQLISSYSYAVSESSCSNMRQLLMQQQGVTCQDQFQVFTQMNQRGYYPTKDADSNEVMTAKNTYAQMQNTLQ